MPELPEVETIRQQLEALVSGARILDSTVYLPKVISEPSPEVFAGLIRGRQILSVTRRGKYLVFGLSGGYTLVIHLRMTGQLIYEEEGATPRHTHLILHLERDRRLRFTDLRQFGRVWLFPSADTRSQAGMEKLGPEPLSPEFTETYFATRLRNSRRSLKPLLLDQQVVAGIGNIYADESLYRAGLHPNRRANSLNDREAKALYRAVKEVLHAGVSHRGTSIRNYLDAEGRAGSHQDFLKVHNRAGRPCPRCGSAIEKTKLGGRGTYFCPSCQRDAR
ncbi:MAG: DNA-formamidopyrimidine glycosylase [Ammonifex sp.]|nr:MAG: DNA-formamidopyrimidine glycosylase [Ammonifex sp.]